MPRIWKKSAGSCHPNVKGIGINQAGIILTYANIPLDPFLGSECCCGVTLVELLSSETVSSSARRSANLSLTSCLELLLCGLKLGLPPLPGFNAAEGKEFRPNSKSEFSKLEFVLDCPTGRYPSLECFLKYFFDLNLFFNSFVKSFMSSPDVVVVQYSCIGCAIL